mgnify:CR=1 FL=1
MKYVIILSIFFSGCMSVSSVIPATVDQVADARTLSVKNAELLNELAEVTAPATPVAHKIAQNADTISATPAPNPFEYATEIGIGLSGLTALLGQGALGKLARNKLKTTLKEVVDMNPQDGHKHLTKIG